ncbi:Uncharacterised protein [Vibrio cholerae]|nr:Uncharacterised protein [Vibrio cholerae]
MWVAFDISTNAFPKQKQGRHAFLILAVNHRTPHFNRIAHVIEEALIIMK